MSKGPLYIEKLYRPIGVIRAAHKGCKSWNPLEAIFLARFSTLFQRKIDLANAFKSFFRDDSFKLCSKIAGILGKQEAEGHKVSNLPQPLPDPFLRAAGKGLAQGQVALIDPP